MKQTKWSNEFGEISLLNDFDDGCTGVGLSIDKILNLFSGIYYREHSEAFYLEFKKQDNENVNDSA